MVRITLGGAFLIALAVAGEGDRVAGTGYSRTAHPVVIDEPSDSFLEDVDEQEEGEPITYRGTGHYMLRQGSRFDDKVKHQLTDFIVWTSQGATLKAEGQCHDGDPAQTTRLSSKAWGQQKVVAKVSAEEGEQATISAENRIGFSYTYNIQGSKILEATVQLNGQCVDIGGGSHRFSLSDTRSSAVTESVRDTRVRGVRLALGGRESEATTRDDAGTSSESTSNLELNAEDTINMTVTRELAQAGGASGGVGGPLIEDSVSGKTPLEKTYDVYSAGSVVLTARGDSSAGGGGVTEVFLENFTIENVLRVYTLVSTPVRNGESDGDPVEEPGSSSPGSGGGDGSEADEEEAADPESENPEERESTADDSRGWMSLDGVPGLDGVRVNLETVSPFGLAGERGGVSGELRVTLSSPADRDLVFAVRVNPEGALSLPRGETITIPAGQIAGGGPLIEAVGSEAFVSLHLLDPDGALTGREVVVRAPLVSTATYSEPKLYACSDGDAWLAGADALITGIRGRRAPDLLIGRLGFDGYGSESTTVSIEVADPQGLLAPLPASVSLTPDSAELLMPLQFADVEGTAVLTLRAGDESLEVHVVSRTQGWSSLRLIRVPLGATVAVPYRLFWSEPDPRVVTASVEGAEHAQVVDGSETDSLSAGALAWATRVRGDALGRTSVRLESEGLAPLVVPIEVVAARVELVAGSLRLSHLPVGCDGTIRLLAPLGVRIQTLGIPPELAEVVVADGLGTDEIVLTLRPSPDLPATLLMPIVLAGEAAGELIFDVDERLAEDAPAVAHNNYQVAWK
jgi:hypothetical protein